MTDGRVCCDDEFGNRVHLSPRGYGATKFWLCPKCGTDCKIVGRRSAVRVGGPKGGYAPLIRCDGCSYRATINSEVWKGSMAA